MWSISASGQSEVCIQQKYDGFYFTFVKLIIVLLSFCFVISLRCFFNYSFFFTLIELTDLTAVLYPES